MVGYKQNVLYTAKFQNIRIYAAFRFKANKQINKFILFRLQYVTIFQKGLGVDSSNPLFSVKILSAFIKHFFSICDSVMLFTFNLHIS